MLTTQIVPTIRFLAPVQFLWNSFYRKRLPQQNGDMRKIDLHTFKLHLEQGRLLSPPPPTPPPHAIRGWRALCVLPTPPPPSTHALAMAKICDFQGFQPKARTASIERLKSVAAEFGQLL